MPPKKVTGAAATAKEHKTNKTSNSSAPASSHGSYKDMIKEAIITLKDRAGSSRQALKKYVRNNNNLNIPSEAQFDSLFNKALKSGVEKGDFQQPKGPSGPVKLAKKEAGDSKKLTGAAATAKKEKEAKESKAAPAKKTATKPKAEKEDAKKADKKTATTKKAPATKTKAKANSTAKRTKTTKAPAPAPAVTEAPTVLKKTKSGRVTKTKGTTTGSTRKAPAKKAAPKKAAKAATPKKAEETKA